MIILAIRWCLPFVCDISKRCLHLLSSPNTAMLCSPLFTSLPSLFQVSRVATFVALGFCWYMRTASEKLCLYIFAEKRRKCASSFLSRSSFVVMSVQFSRTVCNLLNKISPFNWNLLLFDEYCDIIYKSVITTQ